METKNIVILAILGIIAYFLLKKSGILDYIGGGGGGGGVPLIDQPNIEIAGDLVNVGGDIFTRGGVGVYGGGYKAPATTRGAVVQAIQSGATVYSHKMGLKSSTGSQRTSWVSIPQTGTRAALLNVGAQQYQIAPRIYKGKKVM